MYYLPSSGDLRLRLNDSDTVATDSVSFGAGDWLDTVATLDFAGGGDAYVYLNGEEIGRGVVPGRSSPIASGWRLGSSSTESEQPGFAFSEFVVFSRALTAEEVAALHEVDTWVSGQH